MKQTALSQLIVLFCAFSPLALAIDGSTTPQHDAAATGTIQSIVNDITAWQQIHSKKAPHRPFVTVTYAQSLDGKVALLLKGDQKTSTSSNFALSDPESLRMTHALRSVHDAILVGGNTLAIDNPRLNNRLWKVRDQPRPIVLDTHLRHVRKLGEQRRAENVLVCCSQEAAEEACSGEEDLLLPQLLPCPVDSETGRMDLEYLLHELRSKHGIESIMVEGGASVLTTFYGRPGLVDCLCITTAPKVLMGNGLPAIHTTSADSERHFVLDSSSFSSTKFVLLGADAIFLAKLR